MPQIANRTKFNSINGITPAEFKVYSGKSHVPIMDLTHTLPNGVNVRIIGIEHGDGLGFVKKAHATDNYLTSALTENIHVLTEGTKDSSIDMVPQGVISTALEPKEIEKVISTGTNRHFGPIAKILGIITAIKMALDKKRLLKPALILTKPLSPKQEHAAIKAVRGDLSKWLDEVHLGFDHRKFKKDASFVINTRSALMAAEILKHASENTNPKLVIMGVAHASQVYRFIKNPKLGAKYLRTIQKVKEEDDNEEHETRMTPAITRALEIFQQHTA